MRLCPPEFWKKTPEIKDPPMPARSSPSAPPFGFAGEFRAPTVMDRAHQHQELEINFVTQGAIIYLVGGQIRRIPQGQLTVLWAAAPHQVVAVEKGSRFYWFTIPFAWVLQWKLPRPFLERLLKGRLIGWPDAQDRGLAPCERWLEDLRSRDALRLRAAQLEIEACLLRMARGRPGKPPKPDTGAASPTAVQKMLEAIARRYTERLTVADIVAPTGLHPNYGSGLFRRTLGVTISDYLKQHRLFHARRLLAVSDKKIIDIALESGFGAPSRFYEAFLQAYGTSPKSVRRELNRGNARRGGGVNG
jgi:AraC-like DNA-binding protein